MARGAALLGLLAACAHPPGPTIERIWLSHRTPDPSRLVVSWESALPGDSVVRFGTKEVRVGGSRTRHQVEIPLRARDTRYEVRSGNQRSAGATFKGYPTDVLRVAVVANWQPGTPLDAIVRDDVHLLLTAGDNVSDLRTLCGVGEKACTRPYAALIDAYPALFRSIPFMPALGNHDREIRPRGPAPPPDPVYDIDATAFRAFFALPGEEWRWSFDIPGFGVRFVALDLNHTRDVGTTWQSCHPFAPGSDQRRWYESLMSGPRPPFVVTIYNEKNQTVRSWDDGAWMSLLARGTFAVSGFGHFAERAEHSGLSFYNTSLDGTGDRLSDSSSRFLESAHNYLLLTVVRGTGRLTAELKSLDGRVLHRQEHPRSGLSASGGR